MDDRRIFTVFLSIFFAVSTLIPNLYSFLPANVAAVLVSPMVMGVCILLLTTLLCRIGAKKSFAFESGVKPMDIFALNGEIENVCRQRGVERELMRRLQISLDSLCEGVYEIAPESRLVFNIRYDRQQIRLHIESSGHAFAQDALDEMNGTLDVSMMMLKNMFDDGRAKVNKGALQIDLNADL
jgi:hypothetical protein